MKQSSKLVKVNYFLSGQSDKSQAIRTPEIFETVWKSYFSQESPEIVFEVQKRESERADRSLALFISEFDVDANFYFGYVGVFRDTMLPSILNKDTKQDSNIHLSASDEILEKSYFLYYPNDDILVFHQNHLGPKSEDLSYMLFSASGLERVYFDPIWKSSHMRDVLESGSSLHRGYLTLALPRNFDVLNLNFENQFCDEVIGMMSRTGMTRLKLEFAGRASRKKDITGYLFDDIKHGLKEFITRFSKESRTQLVQKAEAQLVGQGKENLLEQELSASMTITVVNGYPEPVEIRKTLVNAKVRVREELSSYISN
ncbi:DUF4868 domain-containing protein [Vibrio crassostreae]|uniref:hypothetical protein n=1 Tax=Vibrio crassostreae TaxID=246167 RepID=UPI001BD6B885|nr:hypothetical protein [Vibrio crassostreae]CAK1723926.1 DUF4868 domain-containing protein [Vibrio crassostreae]CAK1941405.1 DUF4868 domain-containing protein [Vibrio crassostreae]CAK2324688.1 DUF4868 domain-containing protein [Vibrio crassostreae]CAK2331740.1 DUF4868 domain-containing protein [Vibrio crassostreae]CAK2390290.1 DUF4868 domain-containing protein [Vibrio crassostreae]